MRRCPKCDNLLKEEWKVCPYCNQEIVKLFSEKDTLTDTSILPQGKCILRRYRIEREIGTGGMGTFYLATDTVLNLFVAVKTVPQMLSCSQRTMQALVNEARLAMELTHPNIVSIYNIEVEEGEHFIVMEYVEGQTLEQVIDNRGKLKADELIPIALQIVAGLEYAHSKNVLHLDIKPSNILLDKSGRVKVSDFGIARQIKD